MKKLLFTFDQETLDLEIDFQKIKNGAKIKKEKNSSEYNQIFKKCMLMKDNE